VSYVVPVHSTWRSRRSSGLQRGNAGAREADAGGVAAGAGSVFPQNRIRSRPCQGWPTLVDEQEVTQSHEAVRIKGQHDPIAVARDADTARRLTAGAS